MSADTHERKMIEESLRKLSMAVEQSPESIVITDVKGNIEYVNPKFTEITGYTLGEALGQNPRILKSGETPMSVYKELWDTILSGRVWRGEFINKKKNGEYYWESASISPIKDDRGGITHFVAVKLDITEHRRAERLIQVRMRLMEYAVTHTLEEILQETLDEIGEITYSPIGFYHFVEADQRTLSLHAWSTRTVSEFCTAEAKGSHYPIDQAGVWVDCVHKCRPIIHNDYASLPHRKGMPEGHARVIRELAVPIKRGDRTVAILGVGNKPSDYNDKDVDTVSYLADVAWEIAERKRAEEDLRRARDDLEKRVEERTVELKAAKARADMYVDLMGHDINNMNQISRGFLELAQQKIELEGKLTADDVFLVEKAIESIDNSSRLIHNVRKLQNEKMDMYMLEVLDLGKIIEDAIAQIGKVPDRDVTTNYYAARGCYVLANQLLKDVFINLLGNSIKHSSGSLVINLEVNEECYEGRDYWRVVVEDNGPGIPDSRKKTLFDRFNIPAARVGGKGFGLYLIKTLIDDYKGKFRVEDRVPGDHTKGARFVVMLPAASPASSRSDARSM